MFFAVAKISGMISWFFFVVVISTVLGLASSFSPAPVSTQRSAVRAQRLLEQVSSGCVMLRKPQQYYAATFAFTRTVSVMQSKNGQDPNKKPDLFIPIFVGIAAGGYALILAWEWFRLYVLESLMGSVTV